MIGRVKIRHLLSQENVLKSCLAGPDSQGEPSKKSKARAGVKWIQTESR